MGEILTTNISELDADFLANHLLPIVRTEIAAQIPNLPSGYSETAISYQDAVKVLNRIVSLIYEEQRQTAF